MNKHEEIRDQLLSRLDTGFDGSLDQLMVGTLSINSYGYFRSKFRGGLYSHIAVRCLHPAAGDLYGYLKAKEVVSGTARADFRV